MGITEKAFELYEKGYNLIPLQANTKEPMKGIGWKKFQYLRQTKQDIRNLFGNHEGNIGVICGEVSDNLVVLDCDTDAAFKTVYIALQPYGIKAVRSFRGGHIYFRTKVPTKSKNVVTPDGKVEVRSTGLYVVAQDSIHPSGIPYLAVNEPKQLPTFNLGKLPGLDITLDADMSETDVAAILRESGLLERLRSGQYASRSQADMALITFLVRKGYEKQAISNFIVHGRYPSRYVELLEKGSSRASAWLDLSIHKASDLGHSIEFLECRKSMSHIKDLLVTTPIRGKTGSTLYKVLLAHVTTCDESGKQDYHLSVREASEKTGVSHVTFLKQNKWLIENKLIVVMRRSAGIEGNIYRVNSDEVTKFLESQTTQDYTNQSLPTVTNCSTYGYLGIFERGSYGHSANQIYNVLKSHESLSVAELVEKTGRSLNTVRRILKKFTDDGVALRTGNTYRASEMNLVTHSVDKDYVAKSSKRRYTHIKERIEFRAERARLGENYVR